MTFDKITTIGMPNLDDVERRVAETAAALGRKVDTAEKRIQERATQLDAELQGHLTATTDATDRALVRRLYGRTHGEQLRALRKEEIESSSKDREGMLKQLHEARAQIGTLRALTPSPELMLGRMGLGSSRRTELTRQLTGATAVELTAAATAAVATADRELGAALAAVVGRMPSDARPFSVADFARRMVGADFDALTARLSVLELKLRAADDLHREFLGGRRNTLSKIARGVAQRRLAS